MTQENKTTPYTTTPRYIPSDFKNGKLARNEWILYQWMRINADPYGIVTASIPALCDDIFKGKSKNYINKLLLSLRSKRYMYFPNRQGRRGSFEVRFGDFLTPEGITTNITRYFDDKEVRNKNIQTSSNKSEVSQNLDTQSQKLEEGKKQLYKQFSNNSELVEVRTHYNDNENENEK